MSLHQLGTVLYSWDLLFPLTLIFFFFSKGYPQPWNLHFGLGGSKQGECKVEIGVFCQGIVPREIKKSGGYLFWRRGNECIILMATLMIVIIFCFFIWKGGIWNEITFAWRLGWLSTSHGKQYNFVQYFLQVRIVEQIMSCLFFSSQNSCLYVYLHVGTDVLKVQTQKGSGELFPFQECNFSTQ